MKQSSPSSGATPKSPLDLLANAPSLLLHLLLLVVIITGGLCLDSLFRVLSSSVRDWRALWSELLVASALAGVLGSYLWRMQRTILADRRRVVLLAAIVIAAGLATKLIVPGHVLTPYLFPMAAATMLVAVLLDVQLAVVVGIILSLLVGFVGGKSLDLTAYTLVGSVIGALAVSPTGRLSTFAWAALAVGVVNSVVAVSFRLLGVGSDVVGLLELVGASLANGVLSVSLAFTTFFWLGTLLGITTPVQLVELARPTHPLAKRLLLEAPGTYHHSLMVGNLGERAAELIGADPLVVRVAALHHDVGKCLRPYFFVENQTAGENYHEQLDAKTSAQIIISHVQDSLELARKHRFPTAVLDVIAQHHGTTRVGFGHFYQQAVKESNGQVSEVDFCYPGPRPRSKEAAVVMLADGVEAAVRASGATSAAEIERVVRKLTNDRLISGELDDCDLTLRELGIIGNAFVQVLQGFAHTRIQYPEKDSVERSGA